MELLSPSVSIPYSLNDKVVIVIIPQKFVDGRLYAYRQQTFVLKNLLIYTFDLYYLWGCLFNPAITLMFYTRLFANGVKRVVHSFLMPLEQGPSYHYSNKRL